MYAADSRCPRQRDAPVPETGKRGGQTPIVDTASAQRRNEDSLRLNLVAIAWQTIRVTTSRFMPHRGRFRSLNNGGRPVFFQLRSPPVLSAFAKSCLPVSLFDDLLRRRRQLFPLVHYELVPYTK